MRSTYAILFVIFGTALATAQATSPPPVPPIVRWLRANAVRLQTTDPEAPLDDLEPLREIVGDRRLVLLGEPTHGSHEIRLLTHRFIQFLVEHMRFNVVATEIPYPEGLRLNEYVSNGRGITEDILSDLSQEEIHLIHWLRDYNQSALPTAKVHVYGIDIPLVSHPAPPLNYLRRNIPNDLKAFLHKLAPLNEGSVTIPSISAARNGESQYQDALKTLLALFDRYRTTLIQSSSRETWELARHHVVTLQQSHRFSQRLLHWGIGSSPDSLRDLTNEVCVACRSLLARLKTSDTEKTSVFLRHLSEIEQHASKGRSGFDRIGEDDLIRWLETMRLIRDRSLGQSPTKPMLDAPDGNEKAQDLALVIERYLQLLLTRERDTNEAWDGRDRSMAQNLEWILSREGRGARVVVCAHNGHVSRSSRRSGRAENSFGAELHRWYCYKALVVGFSFNRGSFVTWAQSAEEEDKGDEGERRFSVGEAASGSIDRVLSLTGYPTFVVDLRSAPLAGPVRVWLQSALPMRTIGSGMYPGEEESAYEDCILQDAFDVLVFVDRTTGRRSKD